MPADITMVSTADWDNPFWTNKQHVAVELARRGHRVLYIDSLGLRAPSASRADAGRILRRLLRALQPPRQVRPRLWVWSPLVIPMQHLAWVRRLNRGWLTAGLWLCQRWLGLRRELLWTYNPMTTELFPTTAFSPLVYHCVDEIRAQPGMPGEAIDRAEAALLRVATHCFVTAEHLLATRRPLNANTHYFPNVADYEHFAKARDPSTRIPDDVARLPGPRIGFVGAISAYKLDLPLLRAMAQSHPDWSIVLIGKVGEGEPGTDIGSLRDLPNVHFLGPRDYTTLPAYLKSFDAAILPSAINEYTLGMFPMKFFEYLAAGCPVISTRLPALKDYRDIASIAEDEAAFIRAVEDALKGRAAPLSARLRMAAEHTYSRRTARMMQLLEVS